MRLQRIGLIRFSHLWYQQFYYTLSNLILLVFPNENLLHKMKFLKAQGGKIIFNEGWDDFKGYSLFLKWLESFKISEILCLKHSDGEMSFNCLQSLISESWLCREGLPRIKHTSIFRMLIFSCTNNVVNIIISMWKQQQLFKFFDTQ